MSGAEVAGLVLAAIPLVISGLEQYGEGVRTIRRIRYYEAEFRVLATALKTEHAIFLNTLDILLRDQVHEEALEDLLAGTADTGSWSDPNLQSGLKEWLQRSYVVYFDNVKLMSAALNKLKHSLRIDDNGKGPFTANKWSFSEALRKLEFGLKMKAYKDLLDDIKSYNSALAHLTSQGRTLEPIRRLRLPMPPDFEGARSYATSMFDVVSQRLSSSCTVNHRASLRMYPGDAVTGWRMFKSRYLEDRFHIVLHHEPGVAIQSQVPWMVRETEIRPPGPRLLPDPRPGPTPHVSAHRQLAGVIQDLCESLARIGALTYGECLGYLLDTSINCEHAIYWPQERFVGEPSVTALSLDDILGGQAIQQIREPEKRQLGLSLSLGMLRLYDTPWLSRRWGRGDVTIFKIADRIAGEHPFISTMIPAPGTQNLASARPQYFKTCSLIKNETVFALGVLLIELCLGQTLDSLSKPEELKPDGTKHDLSDYLTADRLVEKVYEEAGEGYGDAVRRCIRCHFEPRSTTLSDVAFRTAVYEGVVEELERDANSLAQP